MKTGRRVRYSLAVDVAVPPKIRILISQSEHIAAESSQQPRTKISLGVHIRHQTSGWFCRLASRARQEAAGACFDRTLAVRDDDSSARQHGDRPDAQLATGDR